MTTATIAGLRAARALIERGWTQGELARSAKGNAVLPTSRRAIRWCPEGACVAIGKQANYSELSGQLTREHVRGLYTPVHWWNDAPDRTQSDVLALFDRAIARLEAEKQP